MPHANAVGLVGRSPTTFHQIPPGVQLGTQPEGSQLGGTAIDRVAASLSVPERVRQTIWLRAIRRSEADLGQV